MEKTIKIGDRPVRLNNSIGWAIIYQEQFGVDVVATMLPLVVGTVDLIVALMADAGIEQTGDGVTVDPGQLAGAIGSEAYYSAIAQLSDLKLTDAIHMTWAMAKNADPDLPDPRVWVRDFDEFPLDVVIPEIYGLMIRGFVSRKNVQRLQTIVGSLKPLLSTTSSSPDSSED